MKKIYFIFFVALFVAVSGFTTTDGKLVGETQVRTVQCYPNPATSFVNFEFPTEVEKMNYSLSIYSFIGKKMNEYNVSSTKILLTLENYTRGLYIFQLKDKAGNLIESGKFQVIK
jgi:hypothetical protein